MMSVPAENNHGKSSYQEFSVSIFFLLHTAKTIDSTYMQCKGSQESWLNQSNLAQLSAVKEAIIIMTVNEGYRLAEHGV